MRASEFNELRSLARVVHHRSFARAAAELHVSPSALSQTIRSLEERLGMRLLNRTTRSVAPTEAGSRLFGLYLYYPSRRHTPPALRAFIDFVRERLAAT